MAVDLEFNFSPGAKISKKYQVIKKLGQGWEGEVYQVKEIATGIERAAKFFFPKRNKNNKSTKLYAKKLHKLRTCSILIQYMTQESLNFQGQEVMYLVSDFVEGETLEAFVKKFPGNRLTPFQAVNLLYTLVKGMEEIHLKKEHHGDLHTENIIVSGYGLKFDVRVLDMFYKPGAKPEDYRYDLVECIRTFYEILGGQKYYSRQPKAVKKICCGLKQSLIIKKFKNLTGLRVYLENMTWE